MLAIKSQQHKLYCAGHEFPRPSERGLWHRGSVIVNTRVVWLWLSKVTTQSGLTCSTLWMIFPVLISKTLTWDPQVQKMYFSSLLIWKTNREVKGAVTQFYNSESVYSSWLVLLSPGEQLYYVLCGSDGAFTTLGLNVRMTIVVYCHSQVPHLCGSAISDPRSPPYRSFQADTTGNTHWF